MRQQSSLALSLPIIPHGNENCHRVRIILSQPSLLVAYPTIKNVRDITDKGHLIASVAANQNKYLGRYIAVDRIYIKGLYASEQPLFANRYKAFLAIRPFLLSNK